MAEEVRVSQKLSVRIKQPLHREVTGHPAQPRSSDEGKRFTRVLGLRAPVAVVSVGNVITLATPETDS